MTDIISNFIDGQLVPSATASFIELVDPVTGQPDGTSPVSLTSEVDQAYAAAERAQDSWKRLTPGQRQAYLLDLATAVAARRDEISEVQARDTGQPVRYIASEEVDQGVGHLIGQHGVCAQSEDCSEGPGGVFGEGADCRKQDVEVSARPVGGAEADELGRAGGSGGAAGGEVSCVGHARPMRNGAPRLPCRLAYNRVRRVINPCKEHRACL